MNSRSTLRPSKALLQPPGRVVRQSPLALPHQRSTAFKRAGDRPHPITATYSRRKTRGLKLLLRAFDNIAERLRRPKNARSALAAPGYYFRERLL
jgi:hypothetical protein